MILALAIPEIIGASKFKVVTWPWLCAY